MAPPPRVHQVPRATVPWADERRDPRRCAHRPDASEGSTPVNTSATQATPYPVTRLTVDVPRTFEDFQGQYEQAVPPMPGEEVDALVARGAPWSEMNALISGAAPLGFLIYWKNDVHSVMRLAGDSARGPSTSWATHTIAERMYRHQPAVMLYAPLHTMIWKARMAQPTSPSTGPATSSAASKCQPSQQSAWTSTRTSSPARSPRPARPSATKPRIATTARNLSTANRSQRHGRRPRMDNLRASAPGIRQQAPCKYSAFGASPHAAIGEIGREDVDKCFRPCLPGFEVVRA